MNEYRLPLDNGQLPCWPYCSRCKQPFNFDREEPFAYCNCGTSEWGNPRPASYISNPLHDPEAVELLTKVCEWWNNTNTRGDLMDLPNLSDWWEKNRPKTEREKKLEKIEAVLERNAVSRPERHIAEQILQALEETTDER